MKREIKRRATKQKGIILEELCKVKTHPTADYIFRMTRKRLPAISFGTVYRNLNLLRDEGKVLELSAGRYSCRYDATTINHYHFACLSCGSLFDIDAEILNDIDSTISKKSGMKVEYHRIKFYGYCLNCKNKERKESKMANVKRGDRLSCVPCGREVVVDCCGVSEKVIWCCGRPMKRVVKKKAAKKTAKKK